ncbi:MAG: GAF domain-containing sensor histidine kinase [Pseudomonadota bacterium]|nr:GAF domain-containing sensor histidine kinase [Pseudomonadota bacterium]
MNSLRQLPVVRDATGSTFSQDIAAIGAMEAVPRLLRVLCETTGMGFAAVARVTDDRWIACAVEDRVSFGLLPGGELPVASTLCNTVRHSDESIFIDHASQDPVWCTHHTPRIYSIESYASVPIKMSSGEYFGNLCAIDARPHKVNEPRIVSMFELFAQLIALQLESDRQRARIESALIDERAAGELREQFIAVLGHDLRNPLAAITMGATLLQRKAADPVAVVNTAQRIERSTRRMAALIDDVLDFARGRLDRGIGIEFAETATLGQGLEGVTAELREAHPDRRIVSDISVDGTMRCDPERIQQLLSNLLGNALTHGLPDSPVSVRAWLEDKDVVIEVHNEGDPIPADRLGKVFEPFWRRSASRAGLGLGLYICSQIAKSHGGRLAATSSAGEGTRFVARLPIAVGAPPA